MTLAEFNNIFRNSENGRDFISFFSLFPTYYDKKFVSQLIYDHIAMNMTSEIKVVMDSLEDMYKYKKVWGFSSSLLLY